MYSCMSGKSYRHISINLTNSPSNFCTLQIVLCGRGGQGILFLTRILDEVAVLRGLHVISSETHGMAMRGGSVASFIRIGNFHSPLIRRGQADILMVLAEHELPDYKHFAKKRGSQLYINSKDNIERSIDANGIALQLGSPVSANLVLLGYAAAHPDFPFKKDEITDVLKKISPQKIIDRNITSFCEGYRMFFSCISERMQ